MVVLPQPCFLPFADLLHLFIAQTPTPTDPITTPTTMDLATTIWEVEALRTLLPRDNLTAAASSFLSLKEGTLLSKPRRRIIIEATSRRRH